MESLVLFLPFVLIMGGFMFFASRKQRRAMQATIDLHESLQPGDRVHTTSGLEATDNALTDDAEGDDAPADGAAELGSGALGETDGAGHAPDENRVTRDS